MYDKIEVMYETCSQTKLEQNFNIFVPKIQAKSQNQVAVKALVFTKNIFSGDMATQSEPTKNNLHYSNLEELAF